jgi:hypothetical protein
MLKRKSKRFLHVIKQIRKNAVAEAHDRNIGGVIFGHSHVPCDESLDGIHFLNSGSWVEQPCSFVGIRQGTATQHWWDQTTRLATLAAERREVQTRIARTLARTADSHPAHDHVLV